MGRYFLEETSAVYKSFNMIYYVIPTWLVDFDHSCLNELWNLRMKFCISSPV